jgi:hypothetical protein
MSQLRPIPLLFESIHCPECGHALKDVAPYMPVGEPHGSDPLAMSRVGSCITQAHCQSGHGLFIDWSPRELRVARFDR